MTEPPSEQFLADVVNHRDAAAKALLEAGQMWRDAPDRRTAGNLVLCINVYEDAAAAYEMWNVPPADAAPGLREALRFCRDVLADTPMLHTPKGSQVVHPWQAKKRAAIDQADAALGAPRSGTEGA